MIESVKEVIIINTFTTWQLAIADSWIKVWASFITIIPKIFGTIVVFALGLIIAYWVKKLITEFLKLVRLEKLSEIAGIENYLRKADIKLTFSQLIATIVEWLIIFIFFLAVVDILGLNMVSQVLIGVLGYIPNILAAVLIFAVGYIVAGIVDGLVRGALASVDHEVARPLGRIAKWLILLIAFFASIDQLQIAQGLVSVFYQGLTYTIVLAVGLSVGLGAKDLVSKLLSDWYEKIKK